MTESGKDIKLLSYGPLGSAAAGGALLLLTTLAFVAYVVRRVTRPLRDLAEAADRVAAGDVAARLPETAPAELGILVRRFNAMAAALKETQERLVHSAKLSTVGHLVAGISHELNNPLQGLLTQAELLAGKLDPGADGRKELDLVVAEGRRMQRTLGELRSFVRRSAPEAARVDITGVIRDVLALVRPQAERARVATRARLQEGGLSVLASSDQLRQVVLNLVMNALEAMPAGGELTVDAATERNGGTPRAVVRVRDTGTGIADADLPRVAEPFFSTKDGRMGLGLAICRDIIAGHAGQLAVDSRSGGGTTVTFWLPASS